MDLFSQLNDISDNLLPEDGSVFYHSIILKKEEAKMYFERLMKNIEWINDEVLIFGRRIVTKRKVAWYAEKPFKYSYSNMTKVASLFTKDLLELKELVEEKTKETYNSCLLNLYHNGSEGMGWHSDDEKDLKQFGTIASLSIGAERKFVFKHKKNKNTVSLNLQNGSLLVMKGSTQKNWLHSLPSTKKVQQPRINLTFRTIDEETF